MGTIRCIDLNGDLVQAWQAAGLDAEQGDIMERPGVLVSPANSYGMLDGGLDQVYWNTYPKLQEAVWRELDGVGGELPVGQALVVPNDESDRHPYVILAPTMRTPTVLPGDTVAPYLATRAAVLAWRAMDTDLDLLLPGMGTGVGQVPVEVAARQMAEAARSLDRSSLDCWGCIGEREQQLRAVPVPVA